MLNMINGCKISDPSVLYEAYVPIKSGFLANVNADKIQSLVESFINLHNETCFLILEVPTNAKEEPAFLAENPSPLHKDVYYLDGLSPQRAVELLRTFAPWLIHDGLSTFGFGIHSGGHEIMCGKYNVVTVFARDRQKYHGFFEAHDIYRVDELKTAWDYFNDDSPGESFSYVYEGKNIYDLIEHMKQYGLYFAERREV